MSLNPYYTGIHLPIQIMIACIFLCVLILIILEYIYLLWEYVLHQRMTVLILIILEYIYLYVKTYGETRPAES